MGWLSDRWKYGFTAAQRARSHAAERYVEAITAYEKELGKLSAAEARLQAERVLMAPRLLRVVPWESPPPSRPQLAGSLDEFFRGIRCVEALRGMPRADAADLAPLGWAPGYLGLGPSEEHTHLAVRAGDESIYVIADDVPPEQRIDRVFATVYHWILWLERDQELLAEPDPPGA